MTFGADNALYPSAPSEHARLLFHLLADRMVSITRGGELPRTHTVLAPTALRLRTMSLFRCSAQAGGKGRRGNLKL